MGRGSGGLLRAEATTERKDGLVVFGAQSIMSGDDLTEEEWDAAVIVGTVPYPVLLLIV